MKICQPALCHQVNSSCLGLCQPLRSCCTSMPALSRSAPALYVALCQHFILSCCGHYQPPRPCSANMPAVSGRKFSKMHCVGMPVVPAYASRAVMMDARMICIMGQHACVSCFLLEVMLLIPGPKVVRRHCHSLHNGKCSYGILYGSLACDTGKTRRSGTAGRLVHYHLDRMSS